MNRHRIPLAIATLGLVFTAVACAPKVQIETKDPIVINMNIKIEHEIRVKVDKELDDLFDKDSGLY